MNTILGNREQRENIKKIIAHQTIGHAYLLVGPEGIGKALLAREFAKAILCEQPTDTYCNTCESCHKFEVSSDFIWVQPEDDMIKVGDIRTLEEKILLKPVQSTRKVVLLQDADKMNESAQNALLKILEEPPSYATILLVATNKDKIVKTIQSRCFIMTFLPLTNEEMQQYAELQELPQLSKEELLYAQGSIGRWQRLREWNILSYVMQLEEAFQKQDLLEMNQAFQQVKETKEVKERIQEILELWMIKRRAEMKEPYETAIAQIEIMDACKRNLKRNANFDITLDNMMLSLWETTAS